MFDLVRLDFLDCVGARALAETAQSVPVGCPVIVRAVSPPAARLLGLLALDLERAPATTAPIRQPVPTQILSGTQMRVVRLDEARTWARCVRAAEQMAATEDQVAATFARLAARRPHRADQLTAVSQSARINATRARQWAHDHQALASTAPPPQAS